MKDFFKNLKSLWPYAKEKKLIIFLYVFFNVINIFMAIVFPLLSASILNYISTGIFDKIIYIVLVVLILDLISDFISYICRKLALIVKKNILNKLELDLSKNILKLKNDVLDKNGSGVFIQRLNTDTVSMSEIFSTLTDRLTDFISYVGILIAMFILNKMVFLFTILFFALIYYLEKIRTVEKKTKNKDYLISKEKVSGFTSELVRGARDIKMLNCEDDFILELEDRINIANEKDFLMRYKSWKLKYFNWCIASFENFLLIILLVFLMKKKIISSKNALALYEYGHNLSNCAFWIGNIFDFIGDFNVSSERVFSILNDDVFEKEEFGLTHIDHINGDFEFNNVSFSYGKKSVLHNLSFKINANETVAFVGKSGAGKSTIFNLLCKMYDVKKGKILIDGIDIKNLDKDSIRGNITIISQNPYIFNMSIKDNLNIVKKDASFKEIKRACHLACLDDFISSLSDGYDTIVGEGGIMLSGGQKQRLAIARALIQKTEIILFDEATSALDNETQAKISKAINNMKNEYTMLIIAHRLSTIINADRILVLDNGKIVGEGTHNYLLRNCEEYKNLYNSEINKE